jgi:hypothetical protein
MYPFKTLFTTSLVFLVLISKAQSVRQPDTTKTNAAKIVAVEMEASYPGGNDAWTKYLEKNLNSNVPNKNKAPIGKYTVIVRFIVDKDGSVSNVQPETNFGFGMEDEVVRVLERSGKWTAATKNGQPLRAYRRQPITFLLTTPDFEITTAEPYTLYANTDNEISVTVKKMKPADISIFVEGGKSTATGEGKFIVRANKPGRVTIQLVNNKKDDKEIGLASFEVKAK